MNSNHIVRDGFSNPVTKRFFEKNWSAARRARESQAAKNCGFCQQKVFLPRMLWILCLNAGSPYCFETLRIDFSCPSQEPFPHHDDDIRPRPADHRS